MRARVYVTSQNINNHSYSRKGVIVKNYCFTLTPEQQTQARQAGIRLTPWRIGRSSGFLLDETAFASLLQVCHLELVQEQQTTSEGVFYATLQQDEVPIDNDRRRLVGQRLDPAQIAQDARERAIRRPRTQPVPTEGRERYVQLCTVRLGDVKTDLERRAERERRTVTDLRKQLVDAQRAATEAQDRLDALQAGRSQELHRFGQEYDSLLAHPRIEEVKINGNTIQIFTTLILVQDERDKIWRRIGKFRIDLSGGPEGHVSWHNLNGTVNTGGSHLMYAPHVTSSGQACLGNTREVFADTLAQFEFVQAAGIAIRFVENANVSDPWGAQVNRWPRATDAEIKAFTEATTHA